MKKRSNDRICPHCSHRNQPHQSNCAKCSSPLLDLGSRMK
jgi:ribosomal protein L40E